MNKEISNEVSFAQEVYEKLSSIDISKHVEKKLNLKYLSWAWAWSELMKVYPESIYNFENPVFFEDGTCEIWMTLSIMSHGKREGRQMWLPVMDYKNNSIKNPTSRQISDTRMRCLVKSMAMFGLGMSLYAGEDLPSDATNNYGVPVGSDTISSEDLKELKGLIEAAKSDEGKFCEHFKIVSLKYISKWDYKQAKSLLEKKIKQGK